MNRKGPQNDNLTALRLQIDFFWLLIIIGYASVAQSAEQRFRKPQVSGSNPDAGSFCDSFRILFL